MCTRITGVFHTRRCVKNCHEGWSLYFLYYIMKILYLYYYTWCLQEKLNL